MNYPQASVFSNWPVFNTQPVLPFDAQILTHHWFKNGLRQRVGSRYRLSLLARTPPSLALVPNHRHADRGFPVGFDAYWTGADRSFSARRA
jgi:hypothetical protein